MCERRDKLYSPDDMSPFINITLLYGRGMSKLSNRIFCIWHSDTLIVKPTSTLKLFYRLFCVLCLFYIFFSHAQMGRFRQTVIFATNVQWLRSVRLFLPHVNRCQSDACSHTYRTCNYPLQMFCHSRCFVTKKVQKSKQKNYFNIKINDTPMMNVHIELSWHVCRCIVREVLSWCYCCNTVWCIFTKLVPELLFSINYDNI